MRESIKVSVLCLAYNHEKYIRQCLDGFVMQKTTFPFEVLVHDDASTDGTAAIIREYEEKYPNIIKGIYQTENQYSQNVPFIKKYILPQSKGEYIALCEGDDYWTDPEKLQRQAEALDQYPTCHFCACRVNVVSESGKSWEGKTYPTIPVREGFLSAEETVFLTEQYVFQTSGYFFRGKQYREFKENPPAFVKVADVGDEPAVLYFAHLGGAVFIDRAMSNYRYLSIGSWNARKTPERTIAHLDCMAKMMKLFDNYTNGQYHTLCEQRILSFEYGKAWELNDYKKLLSKEFRNYLPAQNRNTRISIYLKRFCPWAEPFARNAYQKLKHLF